MKSNSKGLLTLFSILMFCGMLFIEACCCGENTVEPQYHSLILLKSTDSSYKIDRLYFVEMNTLRSGKDLSPANMFSLPLNQKRLTTVVYDSTGRIDTFYLNIDYTLFYPHDDCQGDWVHYKRNSYLLESHTFAAALLIPGKKGDGFETSRSVTDTLLFTP